MRCMFFPHTVTCTRKLCGLFLREGRSVPGSICWCGGIHCIWRGLAFATCYAFEALLNWVERKKFSIRWQHFTDQGKNLWFYLGWGDQSKQTNRVNLLLVGGKHIWEARGTLWPQTCFSLQMRFMAPGTNLQYTHTHLSAPSTSPLPAPYRCTCKFSVH